MSEALLFEEHVVYKNCSECQKQFPYSTCSPQVCAWNFHVVSYCGLVNAKIRASDKDLLVLTYFIEEEIDRVGNRMSWGPKGPFSPGSLGF